MTNPPPPEWVVQYYHTKRKTLKAFVQDEPVENNMPLLFDRGLQFFFFQWNLLVTEILIEKMTLTPAKNWKFKKNSLTVIFNQTMFEIEEKFSGCQIEF